MKANGIHPSGGPSDKTPIPVAGAKCKSNAAIAKAAAAKRRKIEADRLDLKDEDEEDVKPIMPKMEPICDFKIQPQPCTAFSPNSYLQIAISPPLSFSQSQPFPSMPLPSQNYALSSQIPRMPAQQFARNVPRQSANQEHIQPAPMVLQARLPMTRPGATDPHAEAPFVLDEKTNALFDDFCNSDIFIQHLPQSSSPVESVAMNTMTTGPAAVDTHPTLPPKLTETASDPPEFQELPSFSEVGSEPQNCVLIID